MAISTFCVCSMWHRARRLLIEFYKYMCGAVSSVSLRGDPKGFLWQPFDSHPVHGHSLLPSCHPMFPLSLCGSIHTSASQHSLSCTYIPHHARTFPIMHEHSLSCTYHGNSGKNGDSQPEAQHNHPCPRSEPERLVDKCFIVLQGGLQQVQSSTSLGT